MVHQLANCDASQQVEMACLGYFLLLLGVIFGVIIYPTSGGFLCSGEGDRCGMTDITDIFICCWGLQCSYKSTTGNYGICVPVRYLTESQDGVNGTTDGETEDSDYFEKESAASNIQ